MGILPIEITKEGIVFTIIDLRFISIAIQLINGDHFSLVKEVDHSKI